MLSIPITTAGVDGNAIFTLFPRKFSILLIFPMLFPETIISLNFRVPFLIKRAVKIPFFGSARVSKTNPDAKIPGSAFNSPISAKRSTDSKSSFTPFPVFAEISALRVCPPQSSVRIFNSESWLFTFATSACGRSILLNATIKGIEASWANFIASFV